MILENISLALKSGEWLALLGPNGSGKSTLLRLMAGLLVCNDGVVTLGDKWLHRPNGVKLRQSSHPGVSSWQRGQRIAFLPQNGGYPEDLSVEEVVTLGRTPHLGLLGRAGRGDLEAVEWAMEQTQVTEFRHRLLPTLSGGERQRVMLARALAGQPQFLLLDEPTNHLDLHHQAEFVCLLAGLRSQGIGVLTVLHDPNLALRADAVAFMHGGRIVAQGQPGQVLKRELLARVYGEMVDVKTVDGQPFVVLGLGGQRD
ncbi:MAG: ABC transporter ATP-binding protein [Meiothermus sp.]|nr:ABC transporter ATP-binding protein [Meiothermus sp.]